MENQIRILQVTSGFRKGVSGGIASVLNNYCTAKTMMTGEVKIDYLSLGYQTFEPYREKMESNGGQLYCLNIHTTGIRRLYDIFFAMRKFFSNNNYDIVHLNSGAFTQLITMSISAKTARVKTIIAHSHNAVTKPKLKQTILDILKIMFYWSSDYYFACATAAAKSMFPKGIIKKHKWEYIPNAINLQKFEFNNIKREEYRMSFGISDKFVIGHVGRFNEQKNHAFLIDVFTEVKKIRKDAVLLLVGSGDLKESIESEVNRRGLSDNVIFTGQRQDVNNIFQAMDLFVFPSLYEGLGMVLIEAQVSGLRVISSDHVPKEETYITDKIQYLPLKQSEWIHAICDEKQNLERKCDSNLFVKSGYEIEQAAKNLKEKYISYAKLR